MRTLGLLILASLVLAGCVGPAAHTVLPPAAEPGSDAGPPVQVQAYRAPTPKENATGGTANGSAPAAGHSVSPAPPSANTTAPEWPAWPPIADAKIRPGMRIVKVDVVGVGDAPVGGCTGAFVFQSPDNRSLYLSTAAHCIDPAKVGDKVDIDSGLAWGVVAYNSFAAMASAGETSPDAKVLNDFALIRIDDKFRPLVHPAVRNFGGPTGMASLASIKPGQIELLSGASGLGEALDPSTRHEGCVEEITAPWAVRDLWMLPTVAGDSGSPVLTAGGLALGVHIRLTANLDHKGIDESVALEPALAYAKEHGGLDARLSTWPLLSGPSLPAQPCA